VLRKFTLFVLMLISTVINQACMFNHATVEIAHSSFPLAGPPFGPSNEEDAFDRINGCLGNDKQRFFYEGCLGYKYVEGGLTGPHLSFDGRMGYRFDFGRR
jgi:hypothetical protein